MAFRATEPPLHIHHREDEAWYFLDGEMTFYVTDEVLKGDSGVLCVRAAGDPTHLYGGR